MSVPIYDFLLDTREDRIVSADQMLNEATKPTYFIFSRAVQDKQQMFKGGEKLTDIIQGEDPGSAEFYHPNQTFNPSNTDTGTQVSVPWAFLKGDYVIIHEARELNQGDPSALANYVYHKEQGCLVSKVNRMEKSVWDDPDAGRMEADNLSDEEARLPYSIKSFVTRDGLAPSSSNGGVASGTNDWSTVQGVNPSNKTWWQNKTATYSAADPNDPNDGIIPAFDEMLEEVHFDMPGPLQQYQQVDPRNQRQVICTSKDGRQQFRKALRAVNDEMNELHDPATGSPMYSGIPVLRISELDGDFTAGQPDYFWLNLDYLFPFFHTDYFFLEDVEPGGANDPNKTVVYKFTWCNWFCRSRRRQGRLYAA